MKLPYKFIPGIAWFFIVLILMCLPGDDLPKIDNWFHMIYGDKWIHMGVFGLLAFLFMYPVSKTPAGLKKKGSIFLWIMVAGSVYGISTELIQKYFIPGRSFDLLDWAADSLGALIAYVFCRIKFLK
jgi:VanZ like family